MSLSTESTRVELHKASQAEFASQNSRYGVTTPRLATGNTSSLANALHKQLFSSFSRDESSEIPTIAQCATHLELLQCFQELRLEVNRSAALDEAFGITPQKSTVTRYGVEVTIGDKTYVDKRKKKWPRFLTIASARFFEWAWGAERWLEKKKADELPLPPLDILMAWHSFLLNPRDYRRFCERHHFKRLLVCNFPWKAIHDAIDPTTWKFEVLPQRTITEDVHLSMTPNLLETIELSGKESNPDTRQFFQKLFENAGSQIFVPSKLTLGLDEADRDFSAYYQKAYSNSLSLVSLAIERQAKFVMKMAAQLWIRSPAANGTLRRAIARYKNFLKLFKLYPEQMFVPTIDIDLVWHTHQCSAARYCEVTIAKTGKFVNHDDTIVPASLDDGMNNTKRIWKMRFSEEYIRCFCWSCEALLETIEKHETDESLASMDWPGIAAAVAAEVNNCRAAEIDRRAK